MAKIETEAQFLAVWWYEARQGREVASRAVQYIKPEMLEAKRIGEAYDYLAKRLAKGESLDDMEVVTDLRTLMGHEWFLAVHDDSQIGGRKLKGYAAKIILHHRERQQASYLASAAMEATALIGTGKGHLLPEKVMTNLMRIHSVDGQMKKPSSREEITRRASERIRNRGASAGVPFPYRKIGAEIGNLLPGDVLGIAAYSNGGKSLLLANLWKHFAISGVPSIVFPTEMGLQWHARGVAAHARIPQMIAEREQWDLATQEQIERYELAVTDLGQCPWEIVDRGNITVDEIISRATMIKKQWPDETVIVMVDHMHRLDYGRKEADFEVGTATKRLKNWAKEEGVIAVLLYQPRKPNDDIELYKPVGGYQLRGKSEVWNELDYLISPYRRWVKTNPNIKTAWGTPSCRYEGRHPEFCAPNDPNGKLDDEHAYIKLAKRRVGGEGPTVVMNVEGPTGRIYEMEAMDARPMVGAV